MNAVFNMEICECIVWCVLIIAWAIVMWKMLDC